MSIVSTIKSLFKSKIDYTRGRYFSAGGAIPPDRNQAGFLSAYSQIGWLHAVVFRIALGVSEVKWRLYKGSDRSERTQIAKHPILDLLDKVNPFMTSPEFIALDTIYQELIGESFWILNYNGLGEPAEIWIPYPHLMQVIPDKQNFVKGYVYGTGINAVPFDVNEVIHFKYPSPLNQYRGLGAAQSIGVNLDAEMYANQWNRNFFYNSARVDAIIEYPQRLTDEQFDTLKARWSEKYKGVNKAHQIGLLDDGGVFKQIQNTVKDMDFSNLSLRNRDVILGVYGMPQSVMGISENVNKANAEAGDYTFARWLVKPRLDWKKAKLQEQLIPRFRNSQNLEIDFDEVVPETLDQKKDLAESGMRAGYLTINEARKLQGLDPLPNGDVLLVPLNLIPTPAKKLTSQPVIPSEPKSKGLDADQKRLHWEAYAKKTERQEEVFKKVFDSLFNDQKVQVVTFYKEHHGLPTELDDDKTAKKFKPAIELVYENAFEDAIPEKGIQIPKTKQLDQFARDWILTRSLTLAKGINLTTLEALKRELHLGFEQAETTTGLVKRIEQYFDANAHMRAERIARTEIIAAYNEGNLHALEEAGVGKSEFYASPDACNECLSLVGEYVTKESHGMIPVHPNCRCRFFGVYE